MDKNFEIMKAMNYGYDNPEFRNKVNPDEMCIDVATKSVIDPNIFEQISLFASMSKDKKAYQMSLDGLKNTKNISNGIDRVRTM